MKKNLNCIFSPDDFYGDLAEDTLVSLSDLGNFMIYFLIHFSFYETLNGLGPYTSFSTLEIFLIFLALLILEVTYHVLNYLLTQYEKTSKNYS